MRTNGRLLLTPGEPVIPCTEVLKEKRGPTGEIETYRVRIVAGGHKQVEGINYSETFSAASGPAEGNHIYAATAWSFKARAGGQGMPPA